MKAAEELGMVNSEYMWLGSALTNSESSRQAKQLPLGMIGKMRDRIEDNSTHSIETLVILR